MPLGRVNGRASPRWRTEVKRLQGGAAASNPVCATLCEPRSSGARGAGGSVAQQTACTAGAVAGELGHRQCSASLHPREGQSEGTRMTSVLEEPQLPRPGP